MAYGAARMDTTTTTYRFTFGDGTVQEFAITLVAPALEMLPPEPRPDADWTRLSHHRCPNCPLDAAVYAQCPVARNLAPACEAFCHRISYDQVDVEVQTEDR